MLKNGWIKCIDNGHLETIKWLYQSSINSGKPIDIYDNNEFIFRWSSENGPLETSKWLYQLSMENGKLFDIDTYKNAFQLSTEKDSKCILL